MVKEDIDKLKDIKDSIGNIFDVIGDIDQGTYLYKMDNDIAFKSVISMNIIVIGEVVNHLPSELKVQLPQFNWDNLIRIRNSVIHQYDNPEKNNEKIWNCYVNNDLENLYTFAEQVIDIYQINEHNNSSQPEEKVKPKDEEAPSPSFTM